ncbi:type I restriction endonuclease subunit M [Brachyspira hampsonii]|uniref:Type I restriction endonuclease subunit M n=1 Tax=Brachyspira hampsonii TaxID=1287055 RepID=A0A1E5NNY3_9SPIR|nr:N-6 DNA methylase [Brachyspira hampsonii]ASJ22504.1 type I restriction endonuclease subunit M [Brachyspira hampsonii]MBW5411346.1 SAM-dependent DNA methyltransferase [Brachyspira hampsonii]OEJ12999.1 type I restriction endonuclease subunit M [Brachyspira hampsonii]OEJ17865.1 type I restriction endonuclease subunit M [Brachyspira hampsonii]
MNKLKSSKYKNLYNILKNVSYKHTIAKVFYDFIAMTALNIAIGISLNMEDKEKRIEQFKKIAVTYDENEMEFFNAFKLGLVNEYQSNRYQDVLGVLFQELELKNDFKGQFFTPYELSYCMNKINFDKSLLESKSFIYCNEPAAGSGGIVIASCQIVEELGYNYAEKLIWNINDLDLMCVYMSFIQLNLIGASALIQHCNTLSMEVFDRFYTLGYILNRCGERLRIEKKCNKMLELIKDI